MAQTIVLPFAFLFLLIPLFVDAKLESGLEKGRETPGVPLFDFETTQFTDAAFSSLRTHKDPKIRQIARLFAFDKPPTGDFHERSLYPNARCKETPGSKSWPSQRTWNTLNTILSDALIPISPLASVCYPNSTFNNFDLSECTRVSQAWGTPELHLSDPGSIFFPLYEGATCIPGTVGLNGSLTLPTGTCTLGGYASYSVNVSSVAQIQMAVNFARNANLRLVPKNTGHDYNGRSTGRDALSVWMHNLDEIHFIPSYTPSSSPKAKAKGNGKDKEKHHGYSGPAFKVAAGVLVHSIYRFAETHNVSIVGGICPTVGITGGYIQGGGHSPLMPLFGVGADQVLELEVVTADGRFISASPQENQDLYWALLGGGGGTFGIVTSAVLKAHPKVPVVTSEWTFGEGVDIKTFWKGFAAMWARFAEWNAAQTYSYWSIFPGEGNSVLDPGLDDGGNATQTGLVFSMNPFFAPNKTVEEYEILLAPFFAELEELGIPYSTAKTVYHESFLPAYDATFAAQPQFIGGIARVPGNRILPKENWDNRIILEQTVRAIRGVVDQGHFLIGYHQAPAPLGEGEQEKNAVNPAFRSEASMLIIASDEAAVLDDLGEEAEEFTEEIIGALKRVSPGGGAYGNEANVNEPGWQQSFWGSNYARLLQIKKKWDPKGLFYVHHGVGSEEWVVEGGVKWGGVPTQNGRLCRRR